MEIGWWQPTEPLRETGSGEIRLVLVERLKKRKHVDEFLAALAAARTQISPDSAVRVSVVGAGPRHDDLQRQIMRSGLGDCVTLLGNRDPENHDTVARVGPVHCIVSAGILRYRGFGGAS